MRLKTKVTLICKVARVAVPVAAVALAGTVVAVKIRRRKRRGHHMPDDLRASVEDLLRLKGEDFVPDGLGTSLYQRKISKLTDRQLLGLYALVKVGEVMRDRGVDLHRPSPGELAVATQAFHDTLTDTRSRHELLGLLEGFGAEVFQSVLKDGALVMG